MRLKSALIVIAAFTVTLVLPSVAFSRSAQCILEIEGMRYIDGPCTFSAWGKKSTGDAGSFEILAKVPGGSYFAYLNRGNANASASWNADPKSNHAQTDLGQMKQDGACWRNDNAMICAWKPDEPRGPEAIKKTVALPAKTQTTPSTPFKGNSTPSAPPVNDLSLGIPANIMAAYIECVKNGAHESRDQWASLRKIGTSAPSLLTIYCKQSLDQFLKTCRGAGNEDWICLDRAKIYANDAIEGELPHQ